MRIPYLSLRLSSSTHSDSASEEEAAEVKELYDYWESQLVEASTEQERRGAHKP